MKNKFPTTKRAGGYGFPPRYVSLISFDKRQITIVTDDDDSVICCSSVEELETECFKLAYERVPFSIGTFMRGPADYMSLYQEKKSLTSSFLSISWIGPKMWSIKEIIPFAEYWEVMDLDELLALEPIDISNLKPPGLLWGLTQELKSLWKTMLEPWWKHLGTPRRVKKVSRLIGGTTGGNNGGTTGTGRLL